MNQLVSTCVRLRALNAFRINHARTTLSASAAFLEPKTFRHARFMGTLKEVDDAESAWKASCYYQMDFTISEDDTVYEAVQKFAAFDVGAFVTLDASGKCFIRCA